MVAPYHPAAPFFNRMLAVSSSLEVMPVDSNSYVLPHSLVWTPGDKCLAIFRFDSGREVSSPMEEFVDYPATFSQLETRAMLAVPVT